MRGIIEEKKIPTTMCGTLRFSSILSVLFLAVLLIPVLCESATVQNFDDPGSYYYLTGSASVQSGGPSGNFVRLVPAMGGRSGALYFNTTDPFLARKIVAEFDFRMFSGYPTWHADGLSITFLNTEKYPDGGTPIPQYHGIWEEPYFEGSLGIGFDIWYNWEINDPNNNHLSVHFNSQKIADIQFANNYQLWREQAPGFDHARIVADLLSGKVSIYIKPFGGTEFAAVENLSVPGLSPYKARVVFGARTGGAWANHDVDNINVTFHPVPIPSALLLIASGLAGVFGVKRRMK